MWYTHSTGVVVICKTYVIIPVGSAVRVRAVHAIVFTRADADVLSRYFHVFKCTAF